MTFSKSRFKSVTTLDSLFIPFKYQFTSKLVRVFKTSPFKIAKAILKVSEVTMVQINRLNRLKTSDAQSPTRKDTERISQSRRSQQSDRMRCCYINYTSQFQVVRIDNAKGASLERTVFPHARVTFEAGADDYLEIHTGDPITSILSDKVPCYRLAERTEYSLS